MKNIIVTLTILCSTLLGYSQDYFITDNKDTTFCSNLEYGTNSYGALNRLQYSDIDRAAIEIKKRKELPNVTTFYQSGHFIDKKMKGSGGTSYPVFVERPIVVTSKDYFILDNKDTTYCLKLWFGTNPQGYLNHLKYTKLDGSTIEIEKKQNVPNVTTFYQQGHSIDKTPLKANKTDSYVRYTERAVNGKLIVYHSTGGTSTSGAGSQEYGSIRFIIKMPDGKYYNVKDQGDMKSYIKPFLLECPEFKKEYKGEFKTKKEPFIQMIKLYNSLCEN